MTSKDLTDAIKEFKKGISSRNRDIFANLNSVTDSDSIKASVKLAYNDAKRTFDGIGKYETERDAAIEEINKKFGEYFASPAPQGEEKFDETHKKLCDIWSDAFKDKDLNLAAFGKAQKIVNMAFKYLYCCDTSGQYKNHFKYCHMPLDSFTLEWFKRNVKVNPKIVAGKMTSWSNLEYKGNDGSKDFFIATDNKEYYTYKFYLDNIRKYILDNNIKFSALELEFVEWPKIQMHLAAEGFLFSLMDTANMNLKKTKSDIRAKSLDDKYAEIVAIFKMKNII